MERINVGLVGCGAWGQKITRKLLNDSRFHLAHIATQSGDVIAEFNNIPHSNNYKDITTNPDINLVYVATPPNTHKDIVFDCIYQDKNFVVEKPLCDKMGDLNEIKDLFIGWPHHKIFLTNFTHLFNPSFIEWAANLPNINWMGSTIYINVKGPVIRKYISKKLDYGSHAVAMALQIFNQFEVEPYWWEETEVNDRGFVYENGRSKATAGLDAPLIICDYSHSEEKDVSVTFVDRTGDTLTWRDNGFDSVGAMLDFIVPRINSPLSNFGLAYKVGEVLYAS